MANGLSHKFKNLVAALPIDHEITVFTKSRRTVYVNITKMKSNNNNNNCKSKSRESEKIHL